VHATYERQFEDAMVKAQAAFLEYLRSKNPLRLNEAQHYREVAHTYAIMATSGGRPR
jgi:hypothetical protein